jgi:TonB family protein
MPLNVRRVYSSLLLILSGIFAGAYAQTVPSASPAPSPSGTTTAQTETTPPVKLPTAAEIMRERISKAKAFIAVRNYNAANYELESIKRESGDPAVQSVVNVLLMNSYLEQGDYKRAQDFLNQAYSVQKTTAPNAAANYFAVAGQIVRGARNRVERYRALGLNVADRTLPLEAVNDLERMRETLELVVTQSKEISKDKAKSSDAMALLEEATASRSMIARDDYDARKWRDEVADAREDLASSRSVVLSAVNDAPANTQPVSTPLQQTQNTASLTPPQQSPVITNTSFRESAPTTGPNRTADSGNKPADNTLAIVKPTVMQQPVNQTPANQDAKKDPTPQYVPNTDPQRNRVVPNQPVSQPASQGNTQNNSQNSSPSSPAGKSANQATDQPTKEMGPLAVGSLIAYATKQSSPVYPVAARNLRTTGTVTIEVTVDEEGNVADIQNATGPSLLQAAAKDAIRKWRFKPFVRDGQPVKATGFVSFNFTL